VRRDRQGDGRTLWIEFHNLYAITSALHIYRRPAKFLAFLQAWNRYHITVSSTKQTHAVHWLIQMLWVGKVPISNIKPQFNHYKFHWGIVWLNFLLRQYNCLPKSSNLLQAQECKLIWSVQCAYNVSECLHDVWSACNSERIRSKM
jgi:hypothetical protein